MAGSPRSRAIELLAALTLAAGMSALASVGPWPAPAQAKFSGGEVIGWGDDSHGQIDIPAAAKSGVIGVAAGCNHSLAVKSNGSIVAWGDDSYGQTDVPAAASSGVVAAVAGCNFNLALKTNGTIVAWGDNGFGQTKVPSLPAGAKWNNIAAGANHSVAIMRLRTGARVGAAWGDDSSGQLEMPKAPNGSALLGAKDVEAGGDNTIALQQNSTVTVWGGGPDGVLHVPSGVSSVTMIAMGFHHVVVLRSNGTVVAWGDNGSGQSSVPKGLSGVAAVSADGDHSLALKSNGTIVAWGSDSSGESSVPALGVDGRFQGVAAGVHHSLAIVSRVPSAPLGVQAAAFDGSAIVQWVAPASGGSEPIAGYTVTTSPGGITCTTAGALTCNMTGLTNGISYTFTVVARNSIGTSAPSDPSPPVTPAAATPTPPPTASSTPSKAPTSSPAPAASPPPVPSSSSGGPGNALIAIGIAALLAAAFARYVYVVRQRFKHPRIGWS